MSQLICQSVDHRAQRLALVVEKGLFGVRQPRCLRGQQLRPVGRAGEQLSVPPHLAGIERLALGVRQRGQGALRHLEDRPCQVVPAPRSHAHVSPPLPNVGTPCGPHIGRLARPRRGRPASDTRHDLRAAMHVPGRRRGRPIRFSRATRATRATCLRPRPGASRRLAPRCRVRLHALPLRPRSTRPRPRLAVATRGAEAFLSPRTYGSRV